MGHPSNDLNPNDVIQLFNKEGDSRGLTCFVKNKGCASTSSLELGRWGPEVRNHFRDVETVRVLAVAVSSVKKMFVLKYIPDLLKRVSFVQQMPR